MFIPFKKSVTLAITGSTSTWPLTCVEYSMVMECSKTIKCALEYLFPLLFQERLLAELEKVTVHEGIDI